jgi:integrase
MPRRRLPPRLYLDPGRREWIIRDGASFIRTGCAEAEHESAEKRLAAHIGAKYAPRRTATPLIADVLLAYTNEHLPHTRSLKPSATFVGNLAAWWGSKTLADVTAANCRAYAASKNAPGARRELEVLRAAINHWHREHGPLASVPAVVMPPKTPRRERWLTRSEVARLLWEARRTPHLARFILLGIHTGSRSRALLTMRWSWIDFANRIALRRSPDEIETKKRTPPVKLGRRILGHLRRWRRLEPKGTLIVHYEGAPIGSLRRSFANACKRAGLGADVTPHILRHSRATWLMQRGVDPWQAAGHLGMSVAILQTVYGKHHPDFQSDAAEV